MLTFSDKETAVTAISLMADALLSVVRANNQTDNDAYAMAVERFLRHLDDTADLVAAVATLDVAREHLLENLGKGLESPAAVSLVYLLTLAMGNPEVTQYWHTNTDRKS